MTVLATDTFSRANVADIDGSTTETGGYAWTSTTAGGVIGITSGKCYMSTIYNSPSVAAYVNVGLADVEISVALSTWVNSDGGISFRVKDDDERWAVTYRFTNGRLSVLKTNGSTTEPYFADVDVSDGDILRVRCLGDDITVWCGGVKIFEFTDSFNNTQTKHGVCFRGTQTDPRIDNFSISTVGASVESVEVGAGFGADPIDDASFLFTDITDRLRSVSIKRGRDGGQDDFQPGTCTLVLKNHDGLFDPSNSSSPYAGALLPRVPIRITCRDSTGTEQILFTGFVNRDNGWQMDYTVGGDGTPGYSDVVVNCSDLLAVWAQTPTLDPASTIIQKYILSRGSNTIGTFVRRVTTLLGDPEPETVGPGQAAVVLGQGIGCYPAWAGAVSGDAPTVLLDKIELGEDTLSFAQKIALTEGGAIYMDREGALVFDGRHGIVNDSRLASPQVVFDDTGSTGVTYSVEDYRRAYVTSVFNQSVVTPINTFPQQYQDSSSVTLYGPSRYDLPGLYMESSAEARARAEFYVKTHKDVTDSPKSLKIKVRRDDDSLDAATQRELRDQVTVKFTPPGVSQLTFTCMVESIEHRIDFSRRTWDCVLGFSSYDGQYGDFADDGIFTLDTDVLNTGLLGF